MKFNSRIQLTHPAFHSHVHPWPGELDPPAVEQHPLLSGAPCTKDTVSCTPQHLQGDHHILSRTGYRPGGVYSVQTCLEGSNTFETILVDFPPRESIICWISLSWVLVKHSTVISLTLSITRLLISWIDSLPQPKTTRTDLSSICWMVSMLMEGLL